MTPKTKNVSPATTMPLALGLVKSQLLWKEYQWSVLSVLRVTYNIFWPSGRYVFVFSSMFNALEGDNEENSAKWTLLRGITIDESEYFYRSIHARMKRKWFFLDRPLEGRGKKGIVAHCGALVTPGPQQPHKTQEHH